MSFCRQFSIVYIHISCFKLFCIIKINSTLIYLLPVKIKIYLFTHLLSISTNSRYNIYIETECFEYIHIIILFLQLLSLCEAEDAVLLKLPCYKSVTDLVPLRKSALRKYYFLLLFCLFSL